MPVSTFIKYVMSFYNPKTGIYPIEGMGRMDVVRAINKLKGEGHTFEYDSIDREIVRDQIVATLYPGANRHLGYTA